MKRITRLLALATVLVSLVACEKPEQPVNPSGNDTTPEETIATPHALVLNEGPEGNNASLSYLDLSTGSIVNNWFASHNGHQLGDVAQDLLVYGSKAYVTVWKSGCLEVVDTTTGVSTHVDLGARGPRYMAADGGKLYITCYNPASVIRIDTATLQIEATCPLGGYNPEGVAIANGKLFAVSSWIGSSSSSITYDDKVYVVDLATFADATPIVVGPNPQLVMAIDNTHLIVNCWGVWNMSNGTTEGEGSAIIDATTLTVSQTGQPFTKMTVSNGMVYGYYSVYDATWNMTSTYLKMDASISTTTPILTSCNINNPYCISANPVTGDIYVGTDGNYSTNGDLYCFSPDGTQRWKREVGMLPSKVVFL